MLSKRNKIFMFTFLLVVALTNVVSASVILSDQGTNVRELSSGNILVSGNLTIEIYDTPNGGTKIYNYTFVNGIVNGSWNIMIYPNLEYGIVYYKDYKINEDDLDFDGNERISFQSSLGAINNISLINFSLINSCPSGAIKAIYENGSVECYEAGGNNYSGNYIYNESGIVYFNETALNVTIDARAVGANLTNYALKNQSETFNGNVTANTGFFSFLGDIASRITKLFVIDADVTNNLDVGGNATIFGNILNATWLGKPITQEYLGGINIPIENTTGTLGQDRVGGITITIDNVTGYQLVTTLPSENITNNRYVNGSGTAGYIALWNETNGINNSVIYQNGTNIGIGTTLPQSKLDVNGSVNISSDLRIGGTPTLANGNYYSALQTNGVVLGLLKLDTNNTLIIRGNNGINFQLVNSVKMKMDGSGNFGINTTSPQAKLSVNGTGELLRIGNGTDTFLYVNGTTGRVGVGTTSPTFSFEVNGPIKVGSGMETSSDFAMYAAYSNRGRIDLSGGTTGAAVTLSGNQATNGFLFMHSGDVNFTVPDKTLYLYNIRSSGNITVDGSVNSTSYCIGSDCKSSWWIDGVTIPVENVTGYEVVTSLPSENVTNNRYVNGSGVTGYIALWNETNGINSSVMYQDGNAINVGRLGINGTAYPGMNLVTDQNSSTSMRIMNNDPGSAAKAQISTGIDFTGGHYTLFGHWGSGFLTNGMQRSYRGFALGFDDYGVLIGQVGTGSGENAYIVSGGTAPTERMTFYSTGNIVVNEQSYAQNFTIESDGEANMIKVDSTTDNVGIGSDSPLTRLYVYESVNGDTSIATINPNTGSSATSSFYVGEATNGQKYGGMTYFNSNYADSGLYLKNSSYLYGANTGGLTIGALNADGVIRFATGSSSNERMRIDSNGNVGIGTTSPEGKLHVADPDYVDTALFERTAQTSDSARATFRVKTTKTTNMGEGFGPGMIFLIEDNAGVENGIIELNAMRGDDDTTGDFAIRPYDSGTGYDALYVKGSTGNLGIGTTSPSEKLNVNGSLRVDNSAGTVVLSVNTTSGNVGVGTIGSAYKLDVMGNTRLYNSDSAVSTLYLRNDNTNPSATALTVFQGSDARLVIKSDSSVGINTTSPQAKLSVNGTGELLRIGNETNTFLYVNGTEGRVGINTSSPTSLLHVNGGMGTTGGIMLGDGDTGFYESVDDVLRVNIGGSNKYYMTGALWGSSSGGAIMNEAPTTTNPNIIPMYGASDTTYTETGIGLNGPSSLALIANGTNTLNVLQNKVGINTITPQNALDVVGTINATGNLTVSGNYIKLPTSSAPESPIAGMMYLNITADPAVLQIYNGTAWNNVTMVPA